MTARSADLLVVAGEASGDRAAAGVLRALAEDHDVRAFGMGGAAMRGAGAELLVDLRDTTAMGLAGVAARACTIGAAYARVVDEAERRRPPAALLVNYTEFNTRLAARLHARGVRVLWYGAPQIWAWRPGRADDLRRVIDRMAVMLPFEEALWRGRGVDAHYVGHPAREANALDRAAAREGMGLTPVAPAIAVLPGSRPHEVRALLDPMLQAFERVRRDRASVDARVLLAPSLDADTRARVTMRARDLDIDVVEVDARVGVGPGLRAFDVALCASGTASLEATLARAVPVVVYKVDVVTELAARWLLKSANVALPNVLLGRAAFPELLQRDVTPRRIAETLANALDGRDALVRACDEVDRVLGDAHRPSHAVARMLRPWLDAPT